MSHSAVTRFGEDAPGLESSVAVIGAGYVGLTTAACLAHLGHRVVAVDVDGAKVERMQAGESPIFEAGLPELMAEGLESGNLSFTTDTASAASTAGFVFLCVPTPQGADGAADLRFVKEAAAQIAPHLRPGAVVVTKSTVPVGSAGAVVNALGRPDTAVVSNPEFLREGNAVHDCLHPDRVVIGSDDRAAAEKLAGLYEKLGAPVLITDPASAETVKYACNAFLAAKVSFVNAIANLCRAVGADSVDVIRGMSYDRRIGADHLAPGPGWGGSCFPKDTKALIHIAADHGYDFVLLKEVVATNERQFDLVADLVEVAAGGSLEGTTVAAWGLTFKAETDDLRDSPALEVLQRVRRRGARIRAFDPTLPSPSDPHLNGLDLELCGDAYSACEGASALVVLTEWSVFRELDLSKAGAAMARPALVDTRNMLDPVAAREAGCSYQGMGRR
jgi:UDPglucose 6-dehydrogenase